MADTLIEQGVKHQLAGRVAEAMMLYRQRLVDDPSNSNALHLFGNALASLGGPAAGIPLIRRAILITGRASPYHFNLGRLLYGQGDFEPATIALAKAVALDPKDINAIRLLGETRMHLASSPDAVERCRKSFAGGGGGLHTILRTFAGSATLVLDTC